MPFKPGLWSRILIALSVLNVASAGYAIGVAEPVHATVHVVLALGLWFWARRLRRGPAVVTGASPGLRDQLDEHTTALEDAEATLAEQSRQLAELQERVDFAERMLVQARERMPADRRDRAE